MRTLINSIIKIAFSCKVKSKSNNKALNKVHNKIHDEAFDKNKLLDKIKAN